MPRILVTGASGLLGSSLTPVLMAAGHDVTRVGRNESADIKADLTDSGRVKAVITQVAPEFVINLAATTDVDYCESHPHQAFLGNTRIVENLAAALAETNGAPHLMQVSTDQVYDGRGPHGEEQIRLVNYYAFSKYAGEIAAACIPSTILRTNFFGRSCHPERLSFSDWIVNALTQGEPVRVFDDVWFSPLSIKRLVGIISITLERRVTGVFNVGSRDGMNKAEFCYRLASCLDLPTSSMIRARSTDATLLAARPQDMRMDCTRFQRTFGIELPSLQQEIEAISEDYHVYG